MMNFDDTTKRIITAFDQQKEDWFCKAHDRFVGKNGKWAFCTSKHTILKGYKNCVIGLHKAPQQISLFTILQENKS